MAGLPKSGMIIPEMGTKPKRRRSGLADALFTPVQQRVLGLLFGQPDRSYQSAELIRLARGGVGAVHRQLSRLVAADLVEVSRSGNQKHYRARRDSPVFAELHGLVVKTVGVADPIRRALTPKAEAIAAAFVYGSVAKGTDRAKSDVDVMVLSDTLSYADVFEVLQSAEAVIGRAVNPDGDDARPVAHEAEPRRLVRRARRGAAEAVPDRLRRCHRLSSRTWSVRASSSASRRRRRSCEG